MKKPNVVHMHGSRKNSIARATVHPGTGRVKINRVLLKNIRPEMSRLRIEEALRIAGEIAKKVDINVNVYGGGWSSQSEAIRLAIAKALVEYSKSEELKKHYLEYDRHLLVADTRRKEQKKPNTHGRARAKRQKSYR